MDICDFFVYIPQYGAGTGSLNVTVAASIVLHHFAGVLFSDSSECLEACCMNLTVFMLILMYIVSDVYCHVLIYTHHQELMKSVDSHGS